MPFEERLREAVDTFAARVRLDLDAHARQLTADVLRLVEEEQVLGGGALTRLLESVRRIDQAPTLGGILEALARGAAAETSRAVVLVVDGGTLRAWAQVGFEAHEAPSEQPIGQSGVLASAIALKLPSFVPPGDRDPSLPSFMRVPAGGTGLVVPIAVGGDVVAMLYADDAGRVEMQEGAPPWTDAVDLLVRHAALRLENVTAIRAAEGPTT